LRLLTILVVGSVIWMILESARLAHSHQVLSPDTPQETLILMPSRSVMALYLFLIVITLIPPASIAALVWLPGRQSDTPSEKLRTRARILYASLVLLGVAVSATISGFAYEALQTELRLSRNQLAFKAGSDHVTIKLADVRKMVLHWRPRAQSVDLSGKDGTSHIDLSAFAAPDQMLLLNRLPFYASLVRLPQRTADEIIWRRSNLPPSTTIEP